MTVVVHPPPHRIRALNARAFLTLSVLALIVVATTGGYRFLTSGADARPALLDVGPASRFPEYSVTYIPKGKLYLIHAGSNRFVAVYEHSRLTQVTYGPTADPGCRLRWYPARYADAGRSPALTVNDRVPAPIFSDYGTGFLRDECTGETFLWPDFTFFPYVWSRPTPLDTRIVDEVGGEIVVYPWRASAPQ